MERVIINISIMAAILICVLSIVRADEETSSQAPADTQNVFELPKNHPPNQDISIQDDDPVSDGKSTDQNVDFNFPHERHQSDIRLIDDPVDFYTGRTGKDQKEKMINE